jgi:hypothetical protein
MKGSSSFLALAAAVALSASSGSAQQEAPRPMSIKDISGGKVQTPEYQIKKSQMTARSRDWFQIITSYESEPDWLDEAQFTYYVLVKNKKPGSKEAPQSLFKGEVTYINVEKGRHKSDMFLHPSTLSRYGDVQAIAVLVFVQGKLVGMESKPPSNQRWWEALQPQDGFLLNRMQTPFAMLYFDDYEAVKPKQ